MRGRGGGCRTMLDDMEADLPTNPVEAVILTRERERVKFGRWIDFLSLP